MQFIWGFSAGMFAMGLFNLIATTAPEQAVANLLTWLAWLGAA